MHKLSKIARVELTLYCAENIQYIYPVWKSCRGVGGNFSSARIFIRHYVGTFKRI